MATTWLQIPDIQANQNQKEVTANAAHDLLDKAQNASVGVAMAAGTNVLSTTQARENFVIELTGTPGAPFFVQMPDTNKRLLAIVNNSDDVATVRNSAAGGSGLPVINVGEASIFHYDGVDFFDLSALALAVATFLGLTDTPASNTGQSGQIPSVNDAETALEYIKTAIKLPVRAATTVTGALATAYENGDAIDGVTLATGDRILIKDQSTGSENGIYIVQATGAPVRAADFDDDIDVEGGVAVAVQEGTVNADSFWILTNIGAITVGSTALTFAELLNPGTFLSLTDVAEANYTDDSGKAVRVNAAETGLEFVPEEFKIPVRAATTTNGALATAYENGDAIDGVTLATGDRILIKDQSTGSENGLYTVNATGAPTRTLDFDDDADAVRGAAISVVEGTNNANTLWQHTTSGAITIGSTALTFAQIGGGTPLNVGTEASVQTTDATVTNIFTVALAAGETKTIRGFGVAQGPSNASVGFDFVVTAHRDGATSTSDGSQIRHNDTGANGWTVTFDVDDTTDVMRIRANGAGATTIDWKLRYEVITET